MEVYFEPPPYGFITFGVGFPVGSGWTATATGTGVAYTTTAGKAAVQLAVSGRTSVTGTTAYINDRFSVIDINRNNAAWYGRLP